LGMAVLQFIQDVLKQPALLLGIIALVGLLAQKRPWYKTLTGTMKPILGYLMLSAGASIITTNLDPLGKMIMQGFHIKGVIPNNEAIVAVAQKVLGVDTCYILIIGLITNILIARFTKYKYIFLTGHHSFYMACLISAVLNAAKINEIPLIFVGGFLLGAWSSISPAIGQKYTLKVTDGDEIACGHFNSLGYYISSWIGSKVGKPNDSTEDMKVPESLDFLRDTTISTALTMVVFFLVAAIAAGPAYVSTLSSGMSPFLYAIICGLTFSVGVTVVYSGVRMILGDLIPAFQGIAQKVIPNAVPAVDCAVFFTYAPTALIIGFICSFIGGLVGMVILGAIGGILIIPGMVPHFFDGATAGIFGNATGGKRGAIIGSFVNGLIITFTPALLLTFLGTIGFQNTTFGDTDFCILGITFGSIVNNFKYVGLAILVVALLIALIVPNFVKTKSKALNNVMKSSTESSKPKI